VSKKLGVTGDKIRRELEKKPVLNANVLEYLVSHPYLFPEEWKRDDQGNTRYIFFFGTIFVGNFGYESVLYMYWTGRGLVWHEELLNKPFGNALKFYCFAAHFSDWSY